jgi:hypothetical protein
MLAPIARPRAALLGLLSVSALLQGCASSEKSAAPPPELQASVTSVQNPGMVVPERGLFAWRPGSRLHPDPRLDASKMDRMIRGALSDAFADKGYELGTAENANLWVGYIGALESALDDVLLNKLFGVNPAWQASGRENRRYEKGTLVVDIVEARTRLGIWRGAVQANVTFDLDDAERRRRIREAVDMLMSRFRVGY